MAALSLSDLTPLERNWAEVMMRNDPSLEEEDAVALAVEEFKVDFSNSAYWTYFFYTDGKNSVCRTCHCFVYQQGLDPHHRMHFV